ncbi:MAG TPA: hypothetical protein VGE48_01725 [Candidatus Paceibacterota bacterium]|jgi:hypothetical protein
MHTMSLSAYELAALLGLALLVPKAREFCSGFCSGLFGWDDYDTSER